MKNSLPWLNFLITLLIIAVNEILGIVWLIFIILADSFCFDYKNSATLQDTIRGYNQGWIALQQVMDRCIMQKRWKIADKDLPVMSIRVSGLNLIPLIVSFVKFTQLVWMCWRGHWRQPAARWLYQPAVEHLIPRFREIGGYFWNLTLCNFDYGHLTNELYVCSFIFIIRPVSDLAQFEGFQIMQYLKFSAQLFTYDLIPIDQ
jgi:hypothetical protein